MAVWQLALPLLGALALFACGKVESDGGPPPGSIDGPAEAGVDSGFDGPDLDAPESIACDPTKNDICYKFGVSTGGLYSSQCCADDPMHHELGGHCCEANYFIADAGRWVCGGKDDYVPACKLGTEVCCHAGKQFGKWCVEKDILTAYDLIYDCIQGF